MAPGSAANRRPPPPPPPSQTRAGPTSLSLGRYPSPRKHVLSGPQQNVEARAHPRRPPGSHSICTLGKALGSLFPSLQEAPPSDDSSKWKVPCYHRNQVPRLPTMASELIYRGGHDAHPPESGSGYTPKPEKHLLWLWRPLRYLLREQRLVFVLVGMALASLLFALAPSSSSSNSYSYSSAVASELALRSAMDRQQQQHHHRAAFEAATRGFVGGKVPLGIKRKGLRIVVTGGAGFVGSHLVDRLIARGDSVIVVDNFFTGRKENVMHHFGNPNFELIRHDVVEPLLLEVDQIYHLACPASPVHYKFNPTNVVGTLNMLGLAKRVGARFLLTSTSEVYGDPLQHPQVETYWGNVNPIGVRSCYDEGKRTAETLTMDYHRGAQVEVRIARIFNTYGPRMCIDDGRVVSNFVAQALRKEPMTVYGDGKQTRSFQYVSDLVEGLMRLMEGEHIGPFNLGNPGEFTMLELAKVVQETIDPNAKIEFRPNTEDDPHKRKPDISRAKELLGWEPKIPLRQGLPLMVSDFRKRIFGDHSDAKPSTTSTATGTGSS
ncbi:RmlD substrate binding domain [Musa troglodytarum]|uniref:UDP-glucuronate decarboxylase n=1 Tax=Musa troglodytarum TaxID=320322 RepID=A0A9E7ELP2_9LILI|nr:RmlD substrate binding domain [Musa troglodytarum]